MDAAKELAAAKEREVAEYLKACADLAFFDAIKEDPHLAAILKSAASHDDTEDIVYVFCIGYGLGAKFIANVIESPAIVSGE
jgi:hypothetical protein